MKPPASPRPGPLIAVLCVTAVGPALAAGLYVHAATSTSMVQVLYFASKVLLFSIPLLWWRLAERYTGPGTQQPSPVSRDLVRGALLGVLIGVVVWSAYAWIFGDVIDAAELANRVERFVSVRHFVWFALFLALVNSGLEEYYWRWFVFGRMRRLLSLWTAITLSSLAFALHHFVVLQDFLGDALLAGVLCVGIAIGGALWALQFVVGGRLWGVWLSHAIVDLAVLSCGYDLLYGSGGAP